MHTSEHGCACTYVQLRHAISDRSSSPEFGTRPRNAGYLDLNVGDFNPTGKSKITAPSSLRKISRFLKIRHGLSEFRSMDVDIPRICQELGKVLVQPGTQAPWWLSRMKSAETQH